MGKVNDFVNTNCVNMQETALYKMAALLYERDVAAPARAEGVHSPNFPWKDVRAHYTLHVVNPRMARYETVRTLSAMRKTLEMRLVREEENGERNIDRANSEMMLKIMTLQSKELSLLNDMGSSSRDVNQGRGPGHARTRSE
tara:strand:+ start:116 stop:541 length:426 start_codon:yes stop_codon:yes gene_type:complete